MENQPGKRRGRPPRAIPPVDVGAEVQDSSASPIGDGEIGEPGIGAQEDDAAEGQGIDWLGLMALVHEEKQQIVRCWHPEPKGELAQLKNGSNIEVLVGETAYQLTTGEIIAL